MDENKDNDLQILFAIRTRKCFRDLIPLEAKRLNWDEVKLSCPLCETTIIHYRGNFLIQKLEPVEIEDAKVKKEVL